MPKYMGHHATMPIPPEMAQALVAKMRSGEEKTWCLTEAPNAEAVHKGHEAMGVN